jgi:hypothetical protein
MDAGRRNDLAMRYRLEGRLLEPRGRLGSPLRAVLPAWAAAMAARHA